MSLFDLTYFDWANNINGLDRVDSLIIPLWYFSTPRYGTNFSSHMFGEKPTQMYVISFFLYSFSLLFQVFLIAN